MAGQVHDEIPASVIDWIKLQHMFWVVSAPLAEDGLINISPKGFEGTFHVVNSHQVWYEDLTGTGIETISHIRENGRITVLFNAFEGPPRIVRLYGRGSVYEFGTPEYDALLPPTVRQPGSRSVIMIDVFKVGTTCGYSVPFYTFRGHRTRLLDWAAKKEAYDIAAESLPSEASTSSTSTAVAPKQSDKGLKRYWRDQNLKSLDNLPGFESAFESPNKFIRPPVVYQNDELNYYAPPSPSPTPSSSKRPLKQIEEVERPTVPDFRLFVAFMLGVMVTMLCGRLNVDASVSAVRYFV